jgi:GT2 family glycosyltransferase
VKPHAYDSVCVVTVTYGQRGHLLGQVVSALEDEGVTRLVIVDNGCDWNIAAWSREFPSIDIDVLQLPENIGSAGGFKAGIERGLELGATLVWLLDDDNRPEPGALGSLLQQYEQLQGKYDASALAVCSFRVKIQQHLLSTWREDQYGKFFRVNIRDLPRRLRLRFLPGTVEQTTDEVIPRAHAPYGGLLLHRAVVERIGYPNEEFVVYSDDLEYTERLTASGGYLGVVLRSRIQDLEPPGHDKRLERKIVFPTLSKGDDLTVFYAARNHAYLDYRSGAKSKLYPVNRSLYLALLFIVALLRGRLHRFRLIISAIRDGESGRLGRIDSGRFV